MAAGLLISSGLLLLRQLVNPPGNLCSLIKGACIGIILMVLIHIKYI